MNCKEKIKTQTLCKCCGQFVCVNKQKCRSGRLLPSLFKLGFDQSALGTLNYYKEFDRIKDVLKNLYYDEKLSCVQIAEIYGFAKHGSFSNILEKFQIFRRNTKECIRNSVITGRWHHPCNFQYKHGYHTTWNGKEIFYRSSYELEYAQQLDEKQIDYEVESLRIEYWDSQECTYRIAIPDFYLPETNEIVEIKSDWTYDPINMKDRVQKYRELNYNFKLFLDKKELHLSD